MATKVVHLGDQLEGINTPRARAVEAQRLMKYLSEFLSDKDVTSAVLTDPFQVRSNLSFVQVKISCISIRMYMSFSI